MPHADLVMHLSSNLYVVSVLELWNSGTEHLESNRTQYTVLPANKRRLLYSLAGSDTTAIVLRACFYYLLKNPRCYTKLVAEIDEADASGRLSRFVSHDESLRLRYLYVTSSYSVSSVELLFPFPFLFWFCSFQTKL